MLLGIIAGLTTCALWGLTFIAPRAVVPFTAWDLTIARYGTFGLACLLLMIDRRFRPTGLTSSRLLIGLLLGGAGYVGYFICAAFAVQFAGAAVPPVIIGTMPVFLAIIANLRDRSARWKALVLPLALIAVGVGIVNVATVRTADAADTASIMLGVLASSAALAIWIAYGLANAAIMRTADAPDGLQWTGLQGIGAAIGSLLLLPLASFDLADTASASETTRFIVWALVMGLAGSWFATWCWVVASRWLSRPSSLSLKPSSALPMDSCSRAGFHHPPRRSERRCSSPAYASASPLSASRVHPPVCRKIQSHKSDFCT